MNYSIIFFRIHQRDAIHSILSEYILKSHQFVLCAIYNSINLVIKVGDTDLHQLDYNTSSSENAHKEAFDLMQWIER